jgi:proteasome lid subunit RPN8/RPN11
MKTIKKHFEDWAPKEACGVFIDNFRFLGCKNISSEDNVFCFCPEEYFNILRQYEIEGIVHSHVNESNSPSEADINTCNAMSIPYYIYSYPTMELNVVLPKLTIGARK